MASVTLELDPIALREATPQAILGILTPEVKTAMIERSIRSLLSASTDSWDKGKTPLQKAFDSAVERVAELVAIEQVSKDEQFKAKLDELLRAAREKVVTIDIDMLATKMAHAFISSLKEQY